MTDPVIKKRIGGRCIPVARPTLTDLEENAVATTIRTGWIASGPQAALFERQIAQSHGKRFGVATNSGTTALHLALAALSVSPGDEVIVPTMTMIACGNAILYQGATPVFVDSERYAGNASAWSLEHLVTEKTKAIIAVHLYGVPCERFIDACRQINPRIPVIEDCAEAHFATFTDGKPVGSRGDLAVFSFYGNKIISCGEGGLVATDHLLWAKEMQSLRAHAFTPGNHFHHQRLAFGYRMGELQAAAGLAQFSRRHDILRRRAELFGRYEEELLGCPELRVQARTAGSANWVFPLLAASEELRDVIRADLAAEGVETRTWFVPLHKQPHLAKFATRGYPVSEDLSRRGLYLPLYFDLSNEDVDFICSIVRRAAVRSL